MQRHFGLNFAGVQSLESLGMSIESGTLPRPGPKINPKNLITCVVDYYEGQQYVTQLDVNSMGQVLLRRFFLYLGLEEWDYFGLSFVSRGIVYWLDQHKSIKKQIKFYEKNGDDANDEIYQFRLRVKLFPPESRQIHNEITRYYLVLQLREDIFSGRLPCSFTSAVFLASLMIQAEMGDYDPVEHTTDLYQERVQLLQTQERSILIPVQQLHQENQGLTPAQTDELFLDRTTRLQYYGVHFFTIESEGPPLILGISSKGLSTYTGEWPNFIKLHEIPWIRVSELNFSKKKLFVNLVCMEKNSKRNNNKGQDVIVFKLENKFICKQLWKLCVEHHGFFRCSKAPKVRPIKVSLFRRGSSFRYTGRTYQTLVQESSRRWEEATILMKRQDSFQRSRLQMTNNRASFLSNIRNHD